MMFGTLEVQVDREASYLGGGEKAGDTFAILESVQPERPSACGVQVVCFATEFDILG